MATTTGLMGLGVPAEMAKRVGVEIVSVTTTGAAQNSAGGQLKGAGDKTILVNLAAATHAVTLPADAELGDVIELINVTGNAGVVFPQTGGTINNTAANLSVPLIAQPATGALIISPATFRKVSATAWRQV